MNDKLLFLVVICCLCINSYSQSRNDPKIVEGKEQCKYELIKIYQYYESKMDSVRNSQRSVLISFDRKTIEQNSNINSKVNSEKYISKLSHLEFEEIKFVINQYYKLVDLDSFGLGYNGVKNTDEYSFCFSEKVKSNEDKEMVEWVNIYYSIPK